MVIIHTPLASPTVKSLVGERLASEAAVHIQAVRVRLPAGPREHAIAKLRVESKL